MSKNSRIYFTILIAIASCNTKQNVVKQKISFDKFEISYTNGWTENFSYLVDSNKIFFFPTTTGVYYGSIPDSIFSTIDSVAYRIINDSSINFRIHRCYDCRELAFKIIKNKDTIRLYQSWEIDSIFGKLIAQLTEFKATKNTFALSVFLDLETRDAITRTPLSPKEFEKQKKEMKKIAEEINKRGS
jgi:hypothetical protein